MREDVGVVLCVGSGEKMGKMNKNINMRGVRSGERHYWEVCLAVCPCVGGRMGWEKKWWWESKEETEIGWG